VPLGQLHAEQIAQQTHPARLAPVECLARLECFVRLKAVKRLERLVWL
jgi:hypothetical protein